MHEPVQVLDGLEQDALTEAFNLSMGSAASSLSEMVGEEVKLSVPDIRFINRAEAIRVLSKQSNGDVSSVSQGFNGPLGGLAMLLFPVDKSLEIVRLMLDGQVSVDKLTEFEEEALCEIGNIILNSGLSSLADIFGKEMQSGLPVFSQGKCEEILNTKHVNEQQVNIVMYLRVDFIIEKHETDGHVIFLLDVNSMNNLRQNIQRYLGKLNIAI